MKKETSTSNRKVDITTEKSKASVSGRNRNYKTF